MPASSDLTASLAWPRNVWDGQPVTAGTLMGPFRRPELPDWMRRRLADGLGGVCLFGGNVPKRDTVRALTAAIHAAFPDAIVANQRGGGRRRPPLTTGSKSAPSG